MYLERRRRRWYALHDIPADVQKVMGRRRFVQSLHTESERVARGRAAVLEAQWRAAIGRIRATAPDELEREAAFWRQAVQNSKSEEERSLVLSMLDDELDGKTARAALKAGIEGDGSALESLPERREANRIFAIASGAMVRFDEHLEEYLSTLKNEPKTVDMKRSTLKRFSNKFSYLCDVERRKVQNWLNEQAQDGKKPDTLRRFLSELRGYWGYLLSIEAIPDEPSPFVKLLVPNAPKNARSDERQPFKPVDVVALRRTAEDDGDKSLADLISLGMWTGARLEELCALKTDKATKEFIEIEDAKTAAGWRQVPVHRQLKLTLQRLIDSSSDGYVLSGLKLNKYGDRSNAIGKRFGRLKQALGFDRRFVFHSIRRTVATLLEDAGVPENVAADILGHEKTTMTYGLYSGGTSLQTRQQAIEKLAYP